MSVPRIYRRYLKLESGHAEEYVEFLKSRELWNEAALRLADVVNNDFFVSLVGKTKHQLWLELCDLITKHPADVTGLPVDAILRGGVRKFTDEVGRLWTSLADFYIRRGRFEQARDVYEEGMVSVVTVRDFSVVFDAYAQFEESLLSAKLEAAAELPPPAEEDDDGSAATQFLLHDTGDDVDLRLARLEHLMHRRPELLSSCMLRQNPHNVAEWLKRVGLFEGDPTRQVLTFSEAVKTVSPEQATGRPHVLWVAFARFYEEHGDVVNARVIFDKATQVAYKSVDDLATVWCEWAEMELRAKNFSGALQLMKRATALPPKQQQQRGAKAEELPVQQRLHRSLRLWSFFADLEESLGTLDGARHVYDSMLDLRIATPQNVLNYAQLLQEHKRWEDSFAVYERGVNAFRWPHCKDLWLAYLAQFVQRYGGTKLERTRDLYEQALTAFPPAEAKALYLAFAAVEQQHGLARHAMDIYARCAVAVPGVADKLEVYELYAQQAMDAFGVPKVRSIYDSAIEQEDLPSEVVLHLCCRYAQLERKLGEIDRGRVLYVHASQFADPSAEAWFWDEWNTFEVRHGNEDTFREMLRIKRSVAASFSNTHFAMSVPELVARAAEIQAGAAHGGAAGVDAFAALEAQAQVATTGLRGFVSAGVTGGTAEPAAGAGNAEEIDLGDGGGDAGGNDEEAAPEEPDVQLEQAAVPTAVFGDVQAAAAANKPVAVDAQEALERLSKRQRVN